MGQGKGQGKCAMGEAKGTCKAECPYKAEGKCAMGEGTCGLGKGKGACKTEGTYGLGKGKGMKACGKAGCPAQKATCPKANATEKAE